MARGDPYKSTGLSKSDVKISRLKHPLLNRRGEKLYKKNSDGCWIWKMAKTKAGYGIANRSYKLILAHRLFYVFYKGEIPSDKVIDHTCDRRDCVNPRHLKVVENHQNVRRGSHVKLNPKKVRFIRRLRSSGMKLKDLASMFGLQLSYVQLVCARRYWKDV